MIMLYVTIACLRFDSIIKLIIIKITIINLSKNKYFYCKDRLHFYIQNK